MTVAQRRMARINRAQPKGWSLDTFKFVFGRPEHWTMYFYGWSVFPPALPGALRTSNPQVRESVALRDQLLQPLAESSQDLQWDGTLQVGLQWWCS